MTRDLLGRKARLDYFQKEELELAKQNNIDLSYYAEKEFDWTQLEEIRLGLLNKVDVSVYAKEEFVSFQMKQIRLGLENRIDTSFYADSHYDWYQMEEIRLGLENKLDVTIYAQKEYDYMNMRQIRNGLMVGINLVPYIEKGYPTPILKQIWKAKEDRINIEPFLEKGYDSEQLEELRKAIKKSVDLIPHIDQTTSGSQMREIRLGLEHKVDVSCYQASEYNWKQMKEIRLGLEKGLEVFWYASKYYTNTQMREIRIGLEEGGNVAPYCTYMLSAIDMKRAREWQKQNEGIEELEFDDVKSIREVSLEKIEVEIAYDGMSATIELPKPKEGNQYTLDFILTVLRENGIKQGIQKETIEEIIQRQLYYEKVIIAKGKDCIPGADGRYEFLFRTEMPVVPKLLPDGSVDYKNIDFFEVVKEGQKIVVYQPPTSGIYGYKVTGALSTPKRGKDLPKLKGKGFSFQPDENAYYAMLDGRIELKGFEMEITPLYIYYGDVTSSVGNIRFEGDILIKGYVGSGVIIEAGGDLVVEGNVEAAMLKAGKNIMIKSGVCAGDIGVIEAGESISGKYFEAVKLIAQSDIRSNYLLNCDSTAMGKIAVAGNKGSITGGVAHAIYGITSYMAGNAAELRTVLDIGMNDVFTKEFSRLDEDANRIKSEIAIFKKSMEKFERTHTPEQLCGLTVYEKIGQAMMVKQEEFDETRRRQTEMVRKIQDNKTLIQVRVLGTAYAGCVIKIDRCMLKTSTTANAVVFRRENNRVAAFSGRL